VPDPVKPSFVIFDTRALWRSALIVRVSRCQKLQAMHESSWYHTAASSRFIQDPVSVICRTWNVCQFQEPVKIRSFKYILQHNSSWMKSASQTSEQEETCAELKDEDMIHISSTASIYLPFVLLTRTEQKYLTLAINSNNDVIWINTLACYKYAQYHNDKLNQTTTLIINHTNHVRAVQGVRTAQHSHMVHHSTDSQRVSHCNTQNTH